MSKIRLVGIIGIVFGLLFLFYLFLGSTLGYDAHRGGVVGDCFPNDVLWR